jgi:cell division protein FtsB
VFLFGGYVSFICVIYLLTANAEDYSGSEERRCMATEQIASNHPSEVWTALVGSITLIGGLVTVLYKRLNADIQDNKGRLDKGADAFSDVGRQLVSIGEKLKALENLEDFSGTEIETLEAEIKKLNDRLLILETEHKGCQDILGLVKARQIRFPESVEVKQK